MSSGVMRTMRGGFYGTGAAQDMRSQVGFRPRAVKLINRDGLCKLDWSEGMADGSGMKQVTAGTLSFITVNGITPLSDGFRLGADTDINVAGELIYYEATE